MQMVIGVLPDGMLTSYARGAKVCQVLCFELIATYVPQRRCLHRP